MARVVLGTPKAGDAGLLAKAGVFLAAYLLPSVVLQPNGLASPVSTDLISLPHLYPELVTPPLLRLLGESTAITVSAH